MWHGRRHVPLEGRSKKTNRSGDRGRRSRRAATLVELVFLDHRAFPFEAVVDILGILGGSRLLAKVLHISGNVIPRLALIAQAHNLQLVVKVQACRVDHLLVQVHHRVQDRRAKRSLAGFLTRAEKNV